MLEEDCDTELRLSQERYPYGCLVLFFIVRFVSFNDDNNIGSSNDALHVPITLIIRARPKRFKDALSGLNHQIRVYSHMLLFKMGTKQDHGLVNVIRATKWARGSIRKAFLFVKFGMFIDLGVGKAYKFV